MNPTTSALKPFFRCYKGHIVSSCGEHVTEDDKTKTVNCLSKF